MREMRVVGSSRILRMALLSLTVSLGMLGTGSASGARQIGLAAAADPSLPDTGAVQRVAEKRIACPSSVPRCGPAEQPYALCEFYFGVRSVIGGNRGKTFCIDSNDNIELYSTHCKKFTLCTTAQVSEPSTVEPPPTKQSKPQPSGGSTSLPVEKPNYPQEEPPLQ